MPKQMKGFFKHTLLTVVALFAMLTARADGDVSFEINTPLMVTAGEMFRVEFVLTNAKPDQDSFKVPSFDGLEVLAGLPRRRVTRSSQSMA